MGHPFHICDLDLHPRKAGPPAAARTSGLVHASNRSAGSAAPPGIRSIRRLQRGWLRRARTACPPLGGCGSHAHGGACATRHPVVRELGDIEFRNLSLPSGKCRDPSLGVARERATPLSQDDRGWILGDLQGSLGASNRIAVSLRGVNVVSFSPKAYALA